MKINIYGVIVQTYLLKKKHWLKPSTYKIHLRWSRVRLIYRTRVRWAVHLPHTTTNAAVACSKDFAFTRSLRKRRASGGFWSSLISRCACGICDEAASVGVGSLGSDRSRKCSLSRSNCNSVCVLTYCRTSYYWISLDEKTSVYRDTRGFKRSAGGPTENLEER